MGPFDMEPDRTWRNNHSDGRTFYGYDDDDGNTAWYDSDGNLEYETETPTDDEQEQNDAGY